MHAYDREHPSFTWVEQAVLDELADLRTAGWRVAVVTNGNVVQQRRKLEHTKIADAVDYCCISQAIRIGHKHPIDTPVADHHFGSVVDAFAVILAS